VIPSQSRADSAPILSIVDSTRAERLLTLVKFYETGGLVNVQKGGIGGCFAGSSEFPELSPTLSCGTPVLPFDMGEGELFLRIATDVPV
jgi:hypothetical protein